MEWLWTGFGLVIGFIEHLQIVTTSSYSAIANSHIQQYITARTMFSGLLCLRQSLSGNGFQSRRSLNFRVHVLTGRRLS
jgi:hypothetical protein